MAAEPVCERGAAGGGPGPLELSQYLALDHGPGPGVGDARGGFQELLEALLRAQLRAQLRKQPPLLLLQPWQRTGPSQHRLYHA